LSVSLAAADAGDADDGDCASLAWARSFWRRRGWGPARDAAAAARRAPWPPCGQRNSSITPGG